MQNTGNFSITNPRWGSLYKFSALAAISVVILIPLQGIIFAVWPPPETVYGWFTLFQKNEFIGLLDMDLLLILDYILLLFVFVAFWAALSDVNPSLTTIALTFQFIGVAAYLASASAFEMLGLSRLYIAATNEKEKDILLAAGQAAYSNWQGTAFNVSCLAGCIALILISVVMLRSRIFSKKTAYLGLIAGILMSVPPTAGNIGIVLSFLSLVPTIPWLIMISLRFLQLSRTNK
jgi:uncharacterized membrane protein YGL010W